MHLPTRPSETLRKLNPHLYPVAPVAHPQRKPDQRGRGQAPRLEGCPPRVRYCVVILSLRRRLVDGHDNLRTGAKPLVDRIAFHLGLDDGDDRITWEYFQARTTGPEGTLVLITQTKTKT